MVTHPITDAKKEHDAVEAIPETGWVRAEISASPTQGRIKITDNGQGIPEDVLPMLMKKGQTYQKSGGSGIGLYHANEKITAWGGSIAIESRIGKGTEVTLTLPRLVPPRWFVNELRLFPSTELVIVDDDASIHQIWNDRIDAFKENQRNDILLRHFHSASSVKKWYLDKGHGTDSTLFLVDYELIGEAISGLDLIKELRIERQSILVTSHFENTDIRNRCEELGVKLIPKGMAGFVPISNESEPAVLIDDDKLTHLLWKEKADRCAKKTLNV